jgi:hypothetical protein
MIFFVSVIFPFFTVSDPFCGFLSPDLRFYKMFLREPWYWIFVHLPTPRCLLIRKTNIFISFQWSGLKIFDRITVVLVLNQNVLHYITYIIYLCKESNFWKLSNRNVSSKLAVPVDACIRFIYIFCNPYIPLASIYGKALWLLL